jgi:RNA polymerase sigma-70 factor (ECF subfamily)
LKNDLNIQTLLNRISLNGDEIAFKQLFNHFANGLSRFTYSILKNRELSEEVVSELFFNIWVHRAKISEIENFKAYLFTSARNISLNYLNKEKRNRAVLLEDIIVPLQINEICPESELISKELKQAICMAIDQLPERCKLIYILAKVEKLKYKEIANILEISVKAIDQQLTIAVRKISKEILQYLNDQDRADNSIVLLHIFTQK